MFENARSSGDDHWANLRNDHLLVEMALRVSQSTHVPPLGIRLDNPAKSQLFCSTEKIGGDPGVYDSDKGRVRIILPYECEREVFLEFHTRHIVSDTGRLELSRECVVSILAGVYSTTKTEVVARPLIVGAPSLDHTENRDLPVDLMHHGWDWYEIYPGDIHEFSAIEGEDKPPPDAWMPVMKGLPEKEVKERLAEILGDTVKKDWPGELNDHYSPSVHLGQKRHSSAFLLKGPAGGKAFREMTPDLLGKRADQIFRLAQSPADILIVQHCHEIGEAVRATLRAFCATPHAPRRFCFIDGRDTYSIFKAYNKL